MRSSLLVTNIPLSPFIIFNLFTFKDYLNKPELAGAVHIYNKATTGTY